MTTKITVEALALWIDNLKNLAKEDTEQVIHWFGATADKPLAIVGGWQRMFPERDYSDIFCCSKSHPEYVMCVKVAVNDGQPCPDFDSLNMPTEDGHVEDSCVPLEWDDDPEAAATFFLMEWHRLMQKSEEA